MDNYSKEEILIELLSIAVKYNIYDEISPTIADKFIKRYTKEKSISKKDRNKCINDFARIAIAANRAKKIYEKIIEEVIFTQ